jgi:hypothetical protein
VPLIQAPPGVIILSLDKVPTACLVFLQTVINHCVVIKCLLLTADIHASYYGSVSDTVRQMCYSVQRNSTYILAYRFLYLSAEKQLFTRVEQLFKSEDFMFDCVMKLSLLQNQYCVQQNEDPTVKINCHYSQLHSSGPVRNQ